MRQDALLMATCSASWKTMVDQMRSEWRKTHLIRIRQILSTSAKWGTSSKAPLKFNSFTSTRRLRRRIPWDGCMDLEPLKRTRRCLRKKGKTSNLWVHSHGYSSLWPTSTIVAPLPRFHLMKSTSAQMDDWGLRHGTSQVLKKMPSRRQTSRLISWGHRTSSRRSKSLKSACRLTPSHSLESRLSALSPVSPVLIQTSSARFKLFTTLRTKTSASVWTVRPQWQPLQYSKQKGILNLSATSLTSPCATSNSFGASSSRSLCVSRCASLSAVACSWQTTGGRRLSWHGRLKSITLSSTGWSRGMTRWTIRSGWCTRASGWLKTAIAVSR